MDLTRLKGWLTRNRSFIYTGLWLLQMLAFMQAIYLVVKAWMWADLAKSSADFEIAFVRSKVIPLINDPHNHLKLKTLADNDSGSSQYTSQVLGYAQDCMSHSALYLAAFLILSLVLYRLFPDARELRKAPLFRSKAGNR